MIDAGGARHDVVVAGLRSRRGASSAILAMVGTGRFELVMSVTLAIEYEEVLKRDPARVAVPAGSVDEFVGFLCANAERELPSRSWPLSEDPDDEFLAQLAVAGACDVMVTHNVRHFRALAARGLNVLTPADFLHGRRMMSQIIVQVPDPVLNGARKLAERQRMTVEEFVARMVAETVRLDDAWEERVQRGREITREGPRDSAERP